MHDDNLEHVFRFFTEIGIIHQLAATLAEQHLPDRLTNVHLGLLGHLSRRPEGSPPQQLAYAFQIPKTSMTHMLRVLDELGMIEIVPNPRDARSKLARITEAGRAQLATTMTALSGEIARMQPALDTEAAIGCLPALQTIREQMDAARDGKP